MSSLLMSTSSTAARMESMFAGVGLKSASLDASFPHLASK